MRLPEKLTGIKALIYKGEMQKGSQAGASSWVNRRSRNIFNGLLRVPVKEKIPALNSI
jgi:hypothetical protein